MTLEEYCLKYPRRATTAVLIYRALIQPRNLYAVVQQLGLCKDHVRRAIQRMHKEGVVHIPKWERSGGRVLSPWRPVWMAGKGNSLPMPKIDKAEHAREYARRKRAKARNARTVRLRAQASLAADLQLVSRLHRVGLAE